MKPTEVRLVSGLLTDQEWDSPEDAAKEIITRLDEKRRDDKLWVVIRPELGLIYGPYPTLAAARRAVAKTVSVHAGTVERVKVARLFGNLEEKYE